MVTTVLKPNANELLKNEIDSRGIKTKFVAKQIGISSSYLGQVLSGSRKLSTDVAIKASRVLGLPAEFFLQ